MKPELARSARWPALMFTAIALLLMSGGALLVGPYGLNPAQTWSALLGNGDAQAIAVVWQIRIPRILAALLVGGALSAAGASYQALFRNPLVSPDILGVSAGAGLGAILGIFLALPIVGIQLFAFTGGLSAVALVIWIAAAVRQADKTLSLVLTGVVVGALAGAVTSLLKVVADPYEQLPAMTFWMLGSLATTSLNDLIPACLAVVVGLTTLMLLSWRINVLAMGDEEANALGINAQRNRWFVIVAATLITASVTALAGLIGWVGLVMPHIARMLVGPAFGRLLPIAIVLGAGYLLAVDTLARGITHTEIPLGILTAMIGAPFFVWLLARSRRGWS